jgi:hypothetical protein
MESNVGTIAITVTSSIEAERLKQNLINSNHSSSSSNNGDPSSGRGNMPSIRMSHDSTGNHDVESGRIGNQNTSSSPSSSAATAAASASASSTTTTSSILNTHLSQRERKISQKLNPNLNPDHPNNSSSSADIGSKSYNNNAGDLPSSTTATTVLKDRKKVLSTRVINSFEISDDSAVAAVSTDRKSKSKK